MRASLATLALCLAAVTAFPSNPQRIIGGSLTTIEQYPFGACLLFTYMPGFYIQGCGGAILNNRAILSAAHCFFGDLPDRWRIRVGSAFAYSGGVVHNTQTIINHPNYDNTIIDNDIAILHSATTIIQNNLVRPASIAGANYNLGDNQPVWAIGWGMTCPDCSQSEQLRHVQVWTVNQETCRTRYQELGNTITDNMLCSGWLDVGGRDQCAYDSGSPLIHNGVVVGVCSWGESCGLARYPGVNARVTRYTAWIQNNA